MNARAALDALPRVVDIMASELSWSRAQKRRQIEQAVLFLRSMGLAPDGGASVSEGVPKGLLERAFWYLGSGWWWWAGTNKVRTSVEYSRAQFEAGEVDALRNAFEKRALGVMVRDVSGGGGGVTEVKKVKKEEIGVLLEEVPGYEGIPVKDCEYAVEEAGFASVVEVDFDEFVEASCSDFSDEQKEC